MRVQVSSYMHLQRLEPGGLRTGGFWRLLFWKPCRFLPTPNGAFAKSEGPQPMNHSIPVYSKDPSIM